MPKVESKLSYCLKHQDRLTDTRCAACLKPICEECTLSTEEGKFCGSECWQKRVASNERVQRLKEEEERERIPRLIRKLVRTALFILFLVALYALYPKIPAEIRKPVEKLFHDFFNMFKASKR